MLCTAGRKTLFRPETAASRLAALAIVVVPGVGVALRRLDASLAAVAAWGVRHVRLLARSFVGAGFTVVVADLLTAETLPRYRAGRDGLAVRVVRLLPSLEETQRRNRERGRRVAPARVAALSLIHI